MGVDIAAGPFDDRAVGDMPPAAAPAGPTATSVNAGRAVGDGRAAGPMIDVAPAPPRQAAAPSGPAMAPPRGMEAAGGSVHSAVGGQAEKAVQLSAADGAAQPPAWYPPPSEAAGMKTAGSLAAKSAGVEAAGLCSTKSSGVKAASSAPPNPPA